MLIAGQIPRGDIGRDTGGLHEVNDQIDTIKPVTKWQHRALTPAEVPGMLHEAFQQLRNGRPRPVHVELPPEAMLDFDEIDLLEPAPTARPVPSSEALEKAAMAIVNAKFPILYAGSGVHLSDAHDELEAVIATASLPVITSSGGKGVIPDDHPMLLGCASRPSGHVAEVYGQADVILAVGTRLTIGSPSPDATIIHIDADEAEIGRTYAGGISLAGDAKATLALLNDALADAGAGSRSAPAAVLDEVREYLASPAERTEPQDSYLEAIREGLPRDGITIFGMTQMGYYSRPFWKTYARRSFLDSGYSGNLGFAYPTAIGAKVACPDQAVVCVSGDGGFGYNSPEMSTAVKYGINVVTVLFNDGHYGNVARDMDMEFGGDYESDFVNPDYMKLADAYGLYGKRVNDPGDLAGVIKDAIDANRPALVEVPVGRLPRSQMLSARPPWATPRK
jgi:acetolactate synthase-1/2/3 large subunit